MNNITILLASFLLLSCSARKTEKQILNDFIEVQLQSTKYENIKNLDVILIKESGILLGPVYTYESNFKNRKYFTNKLNQWIIDSVEITNLKKRYAGAIGDPWNEDDIKNLEYSVITSKQDRDNRRTNYYVHSPEKILLSISKPIPIKNGYALLSFHSQLSNLGFGTIERFTVLMKKVNGKWIKSGYYFDQIYE